MKGSIRILLAAGSAAALVGVVHAQPTGSGARATLFDQPNFQGHWITIVEGAPDLGRWGFSARAMSARFEGDWTVCDAPDLDGRCATARGDVADLTQLGLARIVSLGEGGTLAEQAANAPSAPASVASSPPAPTAPAPTAPSARTDAAPQQLATAARPALPMPAAAPSNAGYAAVFFAKPLRGGAEITVDVQGPANQFCREQGLGPAVYVDTDGHVLRDVLCRRS